jgi:phosphoribosyl 1,2-cyclic phosphodiesterase
VGHTALMLDCGFSLRETERRLTRLGTGAARLTAILLTHEHSDHLNGVGPLARKHGLTVWMTPGTWRRAEPMVGALPKLQLFNIHETFEIDDIQVTPIPVPHDAMEPSQFVFSDGCRRLGVLTDTGSGTSHIHARLSGCDGLVLECNHDRDLLWQGSYPQSVKERVSGPRGHLDNEASAEILASLDNRRLQHIVAAHLSEKNNTPQRARVALSRALSCNPSWVEVADQESGVDWRSLS